MSLSLSPQCKLQLLDLVNKLRSPDNELRKNAENELNTNWLNARPNDLLVGLTEQAVVNEDVSIRSFAAVLLRRLAFKFSKTQEDTMIWSLLDDANQQAIENALLQALAHEKVTHVRHQIGNVISEIANNICYDKVELPQKWPNLLPSLFRLVHELPDCSESIYRIFAAIPMIISRKDLQSVYEALNFGLDTSRSSSMNQSAAFKACCELMRSQDSLKSLDCSLFQPMLNALPSINEHLPDELVECLNLLSELLMTHPKPFKPLLEWMDKFAFSLIEGSPNDEIKRAALELLVTYCESLPGDARKHQDMVSRLVVDSLKMMTELVPEDANEHEELMEWLQDDDLDSDDQDSNKLVAEQALDRISRKLGGSSILPPAFGKLPAMIASQDWKERHAALMAISSIAEGCEKIMKVELSRILDLVVPKLKDEHPRVQWAAANAIGQMSTDFADEIPKKFNNVILPALIEALTSREPRVQSHAAAALVNFSEEADHVAMEPFLDPLLTNLLNLLQSNKKYVQEQAVTTIATVADAAEHKFINYYDVIMPLLLNVLRQEAIGEFRLLRGKTIECATLIALAVGKEKFAPHVQEMINILGQIQMSLTDEDDPQASYLIVAWGRICRILGKDFLPYLSSVMPPLLAMAKAQPDFHIIDSEDEGEKDRHDEEGWDYIPLYGRQVGIKTSILEDRCTATEMLVRYASELQEYFEPYIQTVLEDVVFPGLKFYLEDGVRSAAAKNIPVLINCFAKAHPNEPHLTQNLFKTVLDKVIEVINIEPSPDLCGDFIQAIYESIEVVGASAINDEEVTKTILEVLRKQVTAAQERFEVRDAEAESGEFDTLDDETLEAIEDDERLISEIDKTLHVFFKHKKSAFLPQWETFLPLYKVYINSSNDSLVQWALCGFDDVIEFTGPESWKYNELFLQKMLDGIGNDSSSIRKAAIYGVGVAAQYGGEMYNGFCMAALPLLSRFYENPGNVLDESEYDREAVCIAIARILHFKSSSIDPAQKDHLIVKWIDYFPLETEDEDAMYAYMFLLELIGSQHQVVAHKLEKVFVIVVEAIRAETLQGNLLEQLILATRQLVSMCQPAQKESLANAVPVSSRNIASQFFS